jgi:hypothetical protein
MASMTIKYVLAGAILATSIGCGPHDSPTAPSSFAQEPRPTPQEPDPMTPTVSNTVAASAAGVPGVYRFDAAMSQTGRATVTLKWPNADFSLQLYVTGGGCADMTSLVAGACTVLGKTRPGTLPGVIASPVESGDEITVWVLNPDLDPQAFTLYLEIT